MAKAKDEKVLQGVDTVQSENGTPDNCDNPSTAEAVPLPLGNGGDVPTMAEMIAAEKKRMEEYVTIQLMKDNGRYKDDVYVSVNGQNCVIQRGVSVRIKRKFAMELAKSQAEDQRTAARIALLAEK